MNDNELMRLVLKCMPGYSDGSIRVGYMIMIQNVASSLQIGHFEAKQYLDHLSSLGYFEYKERTENSVEGYLLTEKGYMFYSQI